jgi:hypothetical protein
VSAVAGMPGVGKTALVLHAAHQALREEGWFPGGVLFVDMFGYDPDRRLSAADALLGWLAAAGIPGDHIPATEQDRSRLWRSVLDARPLHRSVVGWTNCRRHKRTQNSAGLERRQAPRRSAWSCSYIGLARDLRACVVNLETFTTP